MFQKSWNIVSIVTVSITYAKEVTVAKLEDMRVGYVSILILFERIVHRNTTFCCKWKLCYNILYLFWFLNVCIWVWSRSIGLSKWCTLHSLDRWGSFHFVVLCCLQTLQLVLFLPHFYCLVIILLWFFIVINCLNYWL